MAALAGPQSSPAGSETAREFGMAWGYLLIAAVFEIGWAIGLKYTDGFTRLWPSVVTIVGMLLSFVFLAQAVRTIPVGTGYAVWTGIGAAGTAILGIVLFGESASWPRLACLALIVAGVIGLKLASPDEAAVNPAPPADAPVQPPLA